jgi:S1-C subfamily serine protease
MRLRAPRRPRLVAAVLTALAACAADTEPASTPVPVEVAAQPCNRPNRAFGLGVVVADGVVATAGHTVDGTLRELTVDGIPAAVIVVDPRTDLALLAVDHDAEPARLTHGSPRVATVAMPSGLVEVEILRTGPLVVHDATDRARYEREVHTFTPGVEDGTSGAPLVDREGRLLGIVILDRPGRGVADAVTARELSALLDRSGGGSAAGGGDC